MNRTELIGYGHEFLVPPAPGDKGHNQPAAAPENSQRTRDGKPVRGGKGRHQRGRRGGKRS